MSLRLCLSAIAFGALVASPLYGQEIVVVPHDGSAGGGARSGDSGGGALEVGPTSLAPIRQTSSAAILDESSTRLPTKWRRAFSTQD